MYKIQLMENVAIDRKRSTS